MRSLQLVGVICFLTGLACAGEDEGCPVGYVTEADGNCTYAGDSAEEDVPTEQCSLTLEVESDCSPCYDFVSAAVSMWNYSEDGWEYMCTGMTIYPGESLSCSTWPSPDGEVKLEWSYVLETGACGGISSGTEFLDCRAGSGETFTFACG